VNNTKTDKRIEALLPFIDMIQDEPLRICCGRLLDAEAYELLEIAPAALSWHHNYEGGLLNHTAEVTRIAVESIGHQVCNQDVIIASALWHDIGKLWEYELKFAREKDLPAKFLKISEDDKGIVRHWVTGQYYRRIYHIQGSAMEFYHQARMFTVNPRLIDDVAHCILAHHGPVKEWGSPVEPQSLEALIVHHADMLSSKFGPTMRRP
jgi:3'-5' exoribonuclease